MAEFDQRTFDLMGADGCLDLTNTDSNAGMIEYDSLVNTYVEPLWQSVCDKISRADFWAMLGKMVLEIAEPTKQLKIPYYFGRKDSKLCRDGTGALTAGTEGVNEYNNAQFSQRLPNEQFGFPEILKTFVNQMGLTLADAGKMHVPTKSWKFGLISLSTVSFLVFS